MPTLVVNGTGHDVALEPRRSLLHVLREELDLTGAKLACGEGVCGACTVLLDGDVVRACITPVADALGHRVKTIEGLAPENGLHPVQGAFLDGAAFQCGFCTPGMILAGASLVDRAPEATDAGLHAAMDGNICRCGTYPRIQQVLLQAVDASRPNPQGPGARTLELPEASAGDPWDLSQDHGVLWRWLGDGLLVVSDDRRAWLHVGADGFVTVASGKVEVGQGSAAELVGVVAAELRAGPASVRVVLGDTDATPYDAGTFGSRTTPDVVPSVAGVASAARAALTAIATAEWGVGPDDVNVAEGWLTSGDRSATFADLVRGLRRVERSAAADVTSRSPGRVMDDTDVVTGRRRFTSDLRLPDMLHGRVLRPPSRDAELLELDTSETEAIDGVQVIRDGDLVGVVAPDPLTAAGGLEALNARWSATSGPSDENLAAHLRANESSVEGWGSVEEERTGDPDEALKSAPIRLAATYTAAYIAHDPLETRAAVARWEDGRVTVWTGTQRPFGVREAMSEALGIAEQSIRVIAAPTGGAYGGKHTGDAALEAARLARAVGRPVKVRWTREEEMNWGYARPAAVIDIQSGATNDGTLVAWDFTNLNSGARVLDPPYRIPNVHVRYQPADGPLRIGSYRALSATANTFARESHIDEIARAADVDPLDIRLRQLSDDRIADVLRAATDHAGWPGEGAQGRGMGLACGVEKDSRIATIAEVRAEPGAPLEILRIVTAFECGPIVDRENLHNQVEGAQVMALGGALFEALYLTDGRIANPRQSQYRVPRFSDVPPIEVILLDRPDLPAAGAGETPMIALAPAIANAIFAACGIRIRSMPLVPDESIPAT
ncbi:MAG TPA: molybdopterin cofactor-binding domain-containing protein [Candidatus Limnocylindria bacterium]|nr:molybdopterin cofactor-binding domain-containing protein [Candidatus Limnocylindria bacterium]